MKTKKGNLFCFLLLLSLFFDSRVQLLLAAVGQVQADKVHHVQGHADDAKVLQDEVEDVGQVEGKKHREATQRHLQSGDGGAADETCGERGGGV